MRKLATVRVIDSIEPIPGADAIEVATVGGWKIVVKKGEFKVKDFAVYIEIDSWVPHALAPFLSKGQPPRVYEGIEGQRLKTVKLRGQVSQGLLLPLSVLPAPTDGVYFPEDGADCSETLGIVKYEPPVSAQLQGVARGNFPSFIRKTEQERVQNIRIKSTHFFNDYEITEKLDGSSMTLYFKDGVMGVCSRNLDLVEVEGNTFWKVARKQTMLNIATSTPNIAFQGELIGPSVQGNRYGLTDHEFYVFDIFNIDTQTYMSSEDRIKACEMLGLKHVPVLTPKDLSEFVWDRSPTIEELLKMADGQSVLNPKTIREGLVFKHKVFPTDISFKVISNKFLLKNDE